MSNIINLHEHRRQGYEAKPFVVDTVYGQFQLSGTLCGNVDVAIPQGSTYNLSPDEVLALVNALIGARSDVVNNSDPNDPRIIERGVPT